MLPVSQNCKDNCTDHGWEVIYNVLNVGQMDVSLITWQNNTSCWPKVCSTNDNVAKPRAQSFLFNRKKKLGVQVTVSLHDDLGHITKCFWPSVFLSAK